MIRTDWTCADIADLFDVPFTELVFRAAEVHRMLNSIEAA
jgi:biotin synthase